MFILDIRVRDKSSIKILKRELNRIKRETMREVAQEFLDRHVAPHFGPANRQRYAHQRRRPVYRSEIKPREGRGQGKFVDNVLSGQSRRRALSLAKITATSNGAKLRLKLPPYFAKPFIGSFVGKDGKRKRITQQPDKVKELKTIDARTKSALKQFADKRFLRRIKLLRSVRTKKLT